MENEKVVSYDYKTVRVKREMEEMLTDAYQNLGWKVTSTIMAEGSLTSVNVSFKRDRKIKNKTELVSLQQKIDGTLSSIGSLQSKKKSAGLVESISTGTVGALVFGGGMSMALTLTGVAYMAGGIVLGVVGLGIGLLGWLVFNKVQKKKLAKLEPLLESEFDKLSELCEEANELLK